MIRTAALSFAIGDFRLEAVSLQVERGEYFVLLGPPGAGKSVFLECLCGLNRVRSGRVCIDGRDVTDLEPRERGIGYVPQDYALFPHQSVAQNIGFGLRATGIDRTTRTQKIGEAAEFLGIRHLLGRSIAGLSGGEQQRVALARALVVGPKILLLDEPVNALDETLRETVCMELKCIQRETGTTVIHVCHNFEETRIVADRVGVLRDGHLVQIGTPEEVFDRPADPEVARFVRVGNVLRGTAERSGGLTRIVLAGFSVYTMGLARGPVTFAIRSDQILVTLAPPSGEPPTARPENHLEGEVVGVSPRGPYVRLHATVAPGVHLVAFVHQAKRELKPGTRVYLNFPASAVHVFEERK